MFYTISKGLLWYLLALILGFIIGYLIRSIMCNRQVARAKADRGDGAELERLRGRVANLEPVVAERDRLRAELDECRASGSSGAGAAAAAAGVAGAGVGAAVSGSGDGEVDASADAGGDADASVDGDVDVDADATTDIKVAADENGAGTDDGAGADDTPPSGVAVADTTIRPAAATPVTDVSGAKEVLGKKIKADDLTAVEGIGPAIAKLCNGIGIKTWAELATTETSLLKTMLTDAGPRFQMHDPGTWPEQASLLAAGRWEDFKRLTDELDGGRRI